jgi:hypothetical protein
MTNLGYAKYGMGPLPSAAAATPIGSGVNNGAVTSDGIGRFSADSPMLWLLGIGAATLGLIAVNTSIKVGKFHASAGI